MIYSLSQVSFRYFAIEYLLLTCMKYIEPRPIVLDVRPLDSEASPIQMTCTSITLCRDVVNAFSKYAPSFGGDPSLEDPCLIWWAQADGMSINKTIGDYLSDSEGSEIIYVGTKDAINKRPEFPQLYVWAVSPDRVTVDVMLAPQLSFSNPIPLPKTSIEGSNEKATWSVFSRGGTKLLDWESGHELSSISWLTR